MLWEWKRENFLWREIKLYMCINICVTTSVVLDDNGKVGCTAFNCQHLLPSKRYFLIFEHKKYIIGAEFFIFTWNNVLMYENITGSSTNCFVNSVQMQWSQMEHFNNVQTLWQTIEHFNNRNASSTPLQMGQMFLLKLHFTIITT